MLMRRWIVFGLLVFALHFAWEMAQSFLFASMKSMTPAEATLLCLRAALGDLVIMATAYVAAAMASRDLTWPAHHRRVAVAMFFSIGLAITIAYERYAVRTGRWQYDARMPVIFGIGIAPLLQWLAVPATVLLIFRRLWRSNPPS